MNKLTELAIRNARGRDRPYPLSDGAGLYLLVNPNGSKWWRFRFRFGRKAVVVKGKNSEKEQLVSCGVYPEVSLREARQIRDEYRALLRKGINPKAQERAAKLAAASTFRLVALEWIQNLEHPPRDSKLRPLSAKTLRRNRYLLNTYLIPELGSMPIHAITVPELFRTLKSIENKGLYETRKKASQLCGKLWRYAVVSGRASRDITPDLRGNFVNPKHEHYAAITEPEGIGQLLRAIDGYTGHRLTVIALKLAPLLFTRPVELRLAKWVEFDLARGMWLIPPERIKQREPHYVPLSRQALELLRKAHAISGRYQYVFANPSRPARPMSNNTLNAALHALGFKDEQTSHGFRALASTRLNSNGFPLRHHRTATLAQGGGRIAPTLQPRGAHARTATDDADLGGCARSVAARKLRGGVRERDLRAGVQADQLSQKRRLHAARGARGTRRPELSATGTSAGRSTHWLRSPSHTHECNGRFLYIP